MKAEERFDKVPIFELTTAELADGSVTSGIGGGAPAIERLLKEQAKVNEAKRQWNRGRNMEKSESKRAESPTELDARIDELGDWRAGG